jgi:hypothetical protein
MSPRGLVMANVTGQTGQRRLQEFVTSMMTTRGTRLK